MTKLYSPFLPYIRDNETIITKYTILDYIYRGLLTTNSVTLYKLSDNTFEVSQKKESLFKSIRSSKIFIDYRKALNYYSKLTKEFYL